MRLTAELFEQITGFKESFLERSEPKSKDPCAGPRLPLTFRTTACRVNGEHLEPPIPVKVCDISTICIGLTHAAKDRLGKTFVLSLRPRKGGGKPVAIHCDLMTFSELDGRIIRVVATFAKFGSGDDVIRCAGAGKAAGTRAARTAAPANVAAAGATVAPAASAPPVAKTVSEPAPASASTPQTSRSTDPNEINRIRNAMLD